MTTKMPSLQKRIIIVLSITALFLGSVIIARSENISLSFKQFSPKIENKNQVQSAARFPFDELTEEEQAVITTPSPNSTKEQLQAHFELVTKIATEAPFLEISECNVRPIALKVALGKAFEVRNLDSVARQLAFDNEHIYTIPPNKSIQIEAGFGKGAGVFGYGCDHSFKAAGMIYVVP